MMGLDIVQMFRMLFKSRKVSRTRVHHKDTIQAFRQKQLDLTEPFAGSFRFQISVFIRMVRISL